MYSWELENYIKERNYELSKEEILFVQDIEKHPQINHIKYDQYTNRFDMWDKDDWHINYGIKQKVKSLK